MMKVINVCRLVLIGRNERRPIGRHNCLHRSLATRIPVTTLALALTDSRQELLDVTKAEVDSSYVLTPRIRAVGRQQTNPIGQINWSARRS